MAFEGNGVSAFVVEEKSGYYMGPGVGAKFAHMTGPPLAKVKKNKLVRGAVIFGVHIEGEPTPPEDPLLDKETIAGEFTHYRRNEDGGIVYDNGEPEVEDRIDTVSTEVPDIPRGSLGKDVVLRVLKLQREILKKGSGTLIFPKKADSECKGSKDNIKEAQDNMLEYQWSKADLRKVNDFERFDPRNSESPYIREFCTATVRMIAEEIGVPGWERMVVYSARFVIDPAGQFHVDRLGYGPGVMVVVTKTNSPYKLLLARMKSGCRAKSTALSSTAPRVVLPHTHTRTHTRTVLLAFAMATTT